MVNEGGGICVDGEGTVIVTETVQLHERRNPGWTRQQVEDELARTIGATTVIWLERGLMGDMQQYRPEVGTNGHVDVLAAFVRPGVVVVHGQPDPAHHDHAVMAENVRRLREARDAQGSASSRSSPSTRRATPSSTASPSTTATSTSPTSTTAW